MPGHMNGPSSPEANVPYDEVFELEDIQFGVSPRPMVAFRHRAKRCDPNPAAKGRQDIAESMACRCWKYGKAGTVNVPQAVDVLRLCGIDNSLFYRGQHDDACSAMPKKMTEGIGQGALEPPAPISARS